MCVPHVALQLGFGTNAATESITSTSTALERKHIGNLKGLLTRIWLRD